MNINTYFRKPVPRYYRYSCYTYARFSVFGNYVAVLWIRIRMDPYHFGNLDPRRHHIKIRIRIRIRIRVKVVIWIMNQWTRSASICRWQAKMYGIWAYFSTFSSNPSEWSGSASDPHQIKIWIRIRVRVMRIQIRIRIRVKVMRIHNTAMQHHGIRLITEANIIRFFKGRWKRETIGVWKE